MNASMITVAFLAMLGIAAECVRLLLYKANGIRLVPSIAKETKDLIIVGDPSTNLCFVGSREPDGAKAVTVNTMERYTRYIRGMHRKEHRDGKSYPLASEHSPHESKDQETVRDVQPYIRNVKSSGSMPEQVGIQHQ